jgi:arylsulfatase A-like enzyme
MTGEGFVPEGFDVLPSREDVLRRNREAGFKDRDAYALWLDDGVGAILDKLKALDIDKDTLFIFVPDHGSFRHGKATLYDYGMRVPMLLRWPGRIAPGSRYDGLLANIDLSPTLLDLAGATPPADFAMDGRSFKPALFGNPAPVREIVFAELGHSRAVKSKQWKYIALRYPSALQKKIANGVTFRGFKGAPLPAPYLTRNGHLGHYASQENPHYFEADQLYDLRKDPEENNNIASQKPEIVRELRKKLSHALKQFPGRPFGEFTKVP